MVAAEEIKLDWKTAKYKVWNTKHKKWYYIVEIDKPSPLNSFLVSEEENDDLYLGSSITSAPDLWGDILNVETGEVAYSHEQVLEDIKPKLRFTKVSVHNQFEIWIDYVVTDSSTDEGYESFNEIYYLNDNENSRNLIQRILNKDIKTICHTFLIAKDISCINNIKVFYYDENSFRYEVTID